MHFPTVTGSRRVVLAWPHPLLRPHLAKDLGKIPEVIARRLGWKAEIVCESIGELDGLSGEIPHVGLVPLLPSGSGDVRLSMLRYLARHSRSIDVLILYHWPIISTAASGLLFKALNPQGVLWSKLDYSERSMRDVEALARRTPLPIRCVRGAFAARYFDVADLVTIETRLMLERLRQKHPRLGPKLALLPNGIDPLTSPSSAEQELRQKYVLTVGNLGTEPKATDVLLEAFAQSRLWPEWTLVLIGPVAPSFRPWLEEFSRRSPDVWRSVILVGEVKSRAELASWYRRALVFCMPSRYESFGIALVEAGYYGCACLATDFPGAVDLLGEEDCGMLCRRDDVADLASALVRLCGDRARIQAYGRKIQRRVVESYTWDSIIRSWEALVGRCRPDLATISQVYSGSGRTG